MRNVTIVLDKDTAEWTRIEAAKHHTSMSRYVGQLLAHKRRSARKYAHASRSYMSRSKGLNLSNGKAYPARDSLHER